MKTTTIAAYCIIKKDVNVLLTEDVGKPGWKIPGGKLEEGELIREAALREVKEETGYEIQLESLTYIHEYMNKKNTHRLRFYFSGSVIGGEKKPMLGEVKKIKWFTLEELKNLEKKAYFLETYYQAVQKFLNQETIPLDLLKNN